MRYTLVSEDISLKIVKKLRLDNERGGLQISVATFALSGSKLVG
jgi:hypothetical protein